MRSGGEHIIRGSLWLPPVGPVLERLQELIRRLTARFGGGAWPQPHVSLLGGIELIAAGADERLASLGDRLPPIPIRLGQLEWRSDPWRCFYAAVEPTPELLDAHRESCDVFAMQPAEPFEPHLSLLYGRIDAPTKAQLARELGGRLNLSFTAPRVHLVNACEAVPAARWRTLHEAPLRARPSRLRSSSSRSLNA